MTHASWITLFVLAISIGYNPQAKYATTKSITITEYDFYAEEILFVYRAVIVFLSICGSRS